MKENILIDTHAHVNSEKFDQDRGKIITNAIENGVGAIINLGDTIESSKHVLELAEAYDICYAGVGVHPEEAFEMKNDDFDKLSIWAKNKKVVCIGEIGLDYYWEKDPEKRDLQKRIFIQQLDLARQLDLPVCVHNRDAHGDTMEILKKEGKGIVGVMHCYSGSLEIARELVKMGWYIGVDGPLTFKNAAKLPEIVKDIPLERILVETDCPYMAPAPMRGKRNEPAFVKFVAEKLAELKGMDFEAVKRQTTINAKSLYTRLK
ncbi:putative deoxyribonuclease YcfH [Anaerovibrio sp. JC8]|uniref:TatD family hydrolase n=1 Tax=Anaerovibrio sp. JC8 TaxID=1240085 RepID=UPI000A0CE8E4|nr:TatD family hydrolase [Anaerovibrio sp. JC8]ORU00888.1 putative deoxyribonuclease YcfH [Anaerovibrio sp. JC8]